MAHVFRANALVRKRDAAADQEAFELLGKAVWAKQEKEPNRAWEVDITAGWPTPLTSA
jgi:hypothetical protein